MTCANPPGEHALVAVLACWKTTDGRYVVYLHEGQRAELCEVVGVSRLTVLGPVPLYRVTDRLAELGYGVEDLAPE